ncbi:MAG: AIR synthase family protein [bacterium]|nr:AIR synthase family protein [bacterium]
MTPYPPGKLPAGALGGLLEKMKGHPRLLVGPRVGEDAAVIDVGERCIVVKSDPITFVEERIGWYAVHVNANDIACMGAAPLWFLMTLLLPEGRADSQMVEAIWADVRSACDELGVTICGGHTEISLGLPRPILCGQMIGEAAREDIIRGEGARPGDFILLTQPVPVEGAAILAEAREKELLPALGTEMIERAKGYLRDPGLSVVAPALAAARTGEVHAMHDPTEGGLATGVHELADAADLGFVIEEEKIPISKEGGAICRALGLDPLGVITSGALLLAVPPEGATAVRHALESAGAGAFHIGVLRPKASGRILKKRDGTEAPLPRFDSDEIGRALA